MCGLPSDRGLWVYVPESVQLHLLAESEETGAGVEEIGGALLLQGLCIALAVSGDHQGADKVQKMLAYRLERQLPPESITMARLAVAPALIPDI